MLRAQLLPASRALSRRLVPFSRFQSTGSFFQGSSDDPNAAANEKQVYNTNKDLRNHPEIKKLLNPTPEKAIDLLSPLKRALYLENLRLNNNVFVNDTIITYNNQKYRLTLTKEEQRALEPSVYAQSYRIKGSWKKTFVFLRMFRRMRVYDALNQCYFSKRAMASDLADMLERAKEDAKKLDIDPDSLVIEHIWVGKDGEDRRMPDFKGRGRTGMKTSHFVHMKAILKPDWVLRQHTQEKKTRLAEKLWTPLQNKKIIEEYVQTANYKW